MFGAEASTTTTTTKVTVTTTVTVTIEARVIGLGDLTGDDQANHRINSTTVRASRTNQNTEDNLANHRIALPMVRQGLAQLQSFGKTLFVRTDHG